MNFFVTVILATTYKSQEEKNSAINEHTIKSNEANSSAQAKYQYLCCALARKKCIESEIEKLEAEQREVKRTLDIKKVLEYNIEYAALAEIRDSLTEKINSKMEELKRLENEYTKWDQELAEAKEFSIRAQLQKDEALKGTVAE